MLRALFPPALVRLLVAFVGLALLYAYAVPVFESPDETTHVGMVQTIATTGQLPVQQVGEETIYAQEGSQPPLYYLIAAQIMRLFDRSDFAQALAKNPHAIVGIPGAVGNKNITLHDQLYPPALHGTVLAVYALRLFSIVLGAVSVTAIFHSGRLLAPQHPGVALLAAGLTAFNPQFLFISASVNNDNLVTALNCLVLWQVLVLLRDGFLTRRSVLMAVLLGLAGISKLSGLVLLPVVALAGLWVGVRRRDWNGLFRLGTLIAGGWLLLAGWWYARNLSLYGDLTGTQRMLDIFGRRPAPPLLELIRDEFAGLRISFWGLFGWFNVFTVSAYYTIMDLLTLVAGIGLMRYLWLNRTRWETLLRVALLGLTVILGGASLLAWTSQTAASQGRLLFPYVLAISALLALGLAALRIPHLVVLLPLGLFALAVPFVTIMPEYTPPAPVQSVPAEAQAVYARFGDIELLGYETPMQRYGPGDSVPVTFYWRPVAQSAQDLSVHIDLLTPQDEPVAKLPSFPGSGSLRTTSWTPGQIYPDSYVIPLPHDLSGHWAIRFLVGWWHYPDGLDLEPQDETGRTLSAVTLAAGAFASGDDSADTLATPVEPLDFGGQIRLLGYTLDGTSLRVQWEALADMDQDYTVLVHVLDAPDGSIIGQGDAPPDFPTGYWHAGERFITQHQIYFEDAQGPGGYPLLLGWYNPVDFARLSADCPDNACPVADVVIPEG